MENSSNIVRIQICEKCYEHLQVEKHDEAQFHSNLEELKSILKHQGLKVQKNKPFNYLSKIHTDKCDNLYMDQNLHKIVRFPKIGAFQIFFQGFLVYSKKLNASFAKIPSMKNIAIIILDIRKRLRNQQNLQYLNAFRNIQFEWKQAETIKISLIEYLWIQSQYQQLDAQQIHQQISKLAKYKNKKPNAILTSKSKIIPYSFFNSQQKFSKIKSIYNNQQKRIKMNGKQQKKQEFNTNKEKQYFIQELQTKNNQIQNKIKSQRWTLKDSYKQTITTLKTPKIKPNNSIKNFQVPLIKLKTSIKRPITSIPRSKRQNDLIQQRKEKFIFRQIQNFSKLQKKMQRSQSDRTYQNQIQNHLRDQSNQNLTNYVKKNIQSAQLTKRLNHSAFYGNFTKKQSCLKSRIRKTFSNQKSTLHQRTFSNISNGKETCRKCTSRQKLFDQHHNKSKQNIIQKGTMMIQNNIEQKYKDENQIIKSNIKQNLDVAKEMTDQADKSLSERKSNAFEDVLLQQHQKDKFQNISINLSNCQIQQNQINLLKAISSENNKTQNKKIQHNKNSLSNIQKQLNFKKIQIQNNNNFIRTYNDQLHNSIQKFLKHQNALIRKILCYKHSQQQFFDCLIKTLNFVKLQQLTSLDLFKQKLFQNFLIRPLRNIFKLDSIKLFPSQLKPIQFNLGKQQSLLPQAVNFLIKINQNFIIRLFQNPNFVSFHGFYCVWLYSKKNKFEQFIVNDHFPDVFCQESKNYKLSSQRSIWYMILEKSIAKMLGSYQNLLQCSYSQLIKILTGCQSVQINNLGQQKLFNFLSQKLFNNKKCFIFAIDDNKSQLDQDKKTIQIIKGVSKNQKNPKLSLIHFQTNNNLRLSSINIQDFCKQFKSISLIFLDQNFYYNQIQIQQNPPNKNQGYKVYEIIGNSKKCLTYISIGNNLNNLKVKIILFQQVLKPNIFLQKDELDYQKNISSQYKYNGQISKKGNFFFELNIKKCKNILLVQNLSDSTQLQGLTISLYSQKQIFIEPFMHIKKFNKFYNSFKKKPLITYSNKQNNQKSQLKLSKIWLKEQIYQNKQMKSEKFSPQKQKHPIKKIKKNQLLKNWQYLNKRYMQDEVSQNIKS